VPGDKIFIYNGSRQSNRYTANVAGLFGSARIAMSDTMFSKGADLAGVRAVVGHEMGHYARMHSVWLAAVFSLLAIFLFWLTNELYPYVVHWTGAREVAAIDDPAGLPVVAIILATLSLLLTPLLNTTSRVAEADADSFSLEHARAPDALAKELVKTVEYRAASPGRLEEIIFYDHPSVERRVRKAMDWKAAHLNGAGAQRR
jgi:STE24 endopeptidase